MLSTTCTAEHSTVHVGHLRMVPHTVQFYGYYPGCEKNDTPLPPGFSCLAAEAPSEDEDGDGRITSNRKLIYSTG